MLRFWTLFKPLQYLNDCWGWIISGHSQMKRWRRHFWNVLILNPLVERYRWCKCLEEFMKWSTIPLSPAFTQPHATCIHHIDTRFEKQKDLYRARSIPDIEEWFWHIDHVIRQWFPISLTGWTAFMIRKGICRHYMLLGVLGILDILAAKARSTKAHQWLFQQCWFIALILQQ